MDIVSIPAIRNVPSQVRSQVKPGQFLLALFSVGVNNLSLARWGEVFGDQVVAAVTIDRIVHRPEVITHNGSSYRLEDQQIDSLPSTRPENTAE